MATFISTERMDKHTVSKYNFKVLSHDGIDEEFTSSLLGGGAIEEEAIEEEPSYTEDDNPNRRDSDIDSSSMSKNSKEALIESLMKKTDEMSSNYIKLQMKLESREEEFLIESAKVKENSFNEGIEAGILKASEDSQDNLAKGIEQFANSVITLENAAKEYDVALENIKADLMSAAVDISKEVISIELSENSNAVAKKLGDSLISELQGASKITLKVNPENTKEVSEHVGVLKHIEVVSDSAISEGGVIAISDVGNIDSQISKRFERVKRAALSE